MALHNTAILHPEFLPSRHTLSFLRHPPSFIPTPSQVDHKKVLASVYDFVRRLQWQHVLSPSSTAPPRFGLVRSTRWTPARLVPQHVLRLSSFMISLAHNFLREQHSCFSSNNLSCDERSELHRLSRDAGLVIKKADIKGEKWVLMRSSNYVSEATRQLTNTDFYQPSTSDSSLFLRQRLNTLLMLLFKRRFINKRQLRFLLSGDHQDLRRFYLLPKLNKDSWPTRVTPPGRPIVSDIISLSYSCSKLIEHFLAPLVPRQSSYLRDTGHLIAVLRTTPIFPSDILFSMDI